MENVYNRALFAKKGSEARNKLRDMGGVGPMGQGAGPGMPSGMAGILASSPELMQAAMRKSVVLPVQQPMGPQPMMAPPMTDRLPPSSPLPNIAGIAPVNAAPAPAQRPAQAAPAPAPRPMAPAPRPMAPAPAQAAPAPAPAPAQRPIKRMQEGGPVTVGAPGGSPVSVVQGSRGRKERRVAGINYKQAQGVANRALTSEKPEDLGLPAGAAELIKDPQAAAAEITDRYLPEEQKTGDLVKDVRKVAELSGIQDIPDAASLDGLNRAIVGAKLGAGIAGDVVNPNTGQALRPTAGKRIATAVAEGLMAPRETAENREARAQQERLTMAQIASNEKIAGMQAAARGGAGGQRLSPLEPYQDAVRDLAGKLVSSSPGTTAEDAMAAARAALGTPEQYYAGLVAQPGAGAAPTLEDFMTVMQVLNPEKTVEELTSYYKQVYGG